MGICHKIIIFRISRVRLAGRRHAPMQADWTFGTGQAIGAHTDAGGQCAYATEAGVGADGPARIHMGTGSADLGRAKGGTGCLCNYGYNAQLGGQNG